MTPVPPRKIPPETVFVRPRIERRAPQRCALNTLVLELELTPTVTPAERRSGLSVRVESAGEG